MQSCTKLVSTVGGTTTSFLSKCSFCDRLFTRSVSTPTSTVSNRRNFATATKAPSSGEAIRIKSDVLFPSWRRSLVTLLHNSPHNSNYRRSYSSNKRGETILMDSSTSHTSSRSSDRISFGENTQNLQGESSCSIRSPCSSSSEQKPLFVNRTGGNCGSSNNDNGGNRGASSVLPPSAPMVGTASPSTHFGISSTGTATFTSIRTVVTSQRLVEVSRESIMDQPKLMSKEEREEFMSVYHNLVKDLLEIPDMKDMGETNRWMARVLQYNVPHGKRNRGLYTALAYKYFAPEELTEENVRLSYILGWCVEILQAFFLVSDDIMDESETRRGRPCWYKVDNLGLAAVNDAVMLESIIYQIVRKHFSEKSCYAKLMEVMHDVTYKTIFGQSLDTRTGQDRRMETYTMERYSSIVKYKTSYYSFYLPVALAMTFCDIKDPNLYQQARKVTLEMGHFFQVQDDYLDCFGDEEVTGKIGTDIQDCKCSWLFVMAVQRCDPDQKKHLLANYGVNEPAKIQTVKQLYKDLGLVELYQNYEEQTYNLICTHVQQMNEELPKGLFYDMLHKIYKRSS